MKTIKINFVKNKSLGNIYNTSKPDNSKSFEDSIVLYRKNKKTIDDSINETMEFNNFSNGGSITIPTLNCIDKGFINSLQFEVENIEMDTCFLSLKKVNF